MPRGENCERRARGGKRPGAGRKRNKYRLDAPHRMRERFEDPVPIHVTMRAQRYIDYLRCDEIYNVIAGVLERYKSKRWASEFRVVHFSLQDNHLHMIVEASNDRVFRRAMRSFTVNSARAINAVLGTTGRVWFRYHSTVIKTKRYARYCIAYVLGNWRRHHKDIVHGQFVAAILDRYSSAISFDGWNKRFRIPPGYRPLPVSSPTTFLLTTGWAYNGPLDPFQVPGPLWG